MSHLRRLNHIRYICKSCTCVNKTTYCILLCLITNVCNFVCKRTMLVVWVFLLTSFLTSFSYSHGKFSYQTFYKKHLLASGFWIFPSYNVSLVCFLVILLTLFRRSFRKAWLIRTKLSLKTIHSWLTFNDIKFCFAFILKRNVPYFNWTNIVHIHC